MNTENPVKQKPEDTEFRDLLERVKKGDGEALDTLYKNYRQFVDAAIRRYGSPTDPAVTVSDVAPMESASLPASRVSLAAMTISVCVNPLNPGALMDTE